METHTQADICFTLYGFWFTKICNCCPKKKITENSKFFHSIQNLLFCKFCHYRVSSLPKFEWFPVLTLFCSPFLSSGKKAKRIWGKEERGESRHSSTIPAFDCKSEHTKAAAFISTPSLMPPNCPSDFLPVGREAGTFTVLSIVGEAEARGAGAVVGAGRVLAGVLAQPPRVIPALVDVCRHSEKRHNQLRGTGKTRAGGWFWKCQGLVCGV